MKTTVKKSNTVKKPVVKAKAAPVKKAAGKPVKTPVAKASKPAAKPASKSVPKVATKVAAKPTHKAPAKPVAKKALAKLVTKPTAKPTAKPLAKPAAKPAPNPAKKVLVAPAKPAQSILPAKTAGKASAKPAAKKPVVTAQTAKATAPIPKKAPISVSVKTPAKVPANPPVKAVAAPSTSKPSAKQSAAAPSKPVVLAAAPVPAPPKPRTSKSGFISPANIAPKSMEVSTAAKTNFTMSSPVLAPPPQVAVKKDAKLVNNWKTKTAAQLADAEAIAMPDSEYMSALQMAFFRLKLVQLKKDILSNAGETTEHLREDTSVVPDPADRATIEEEHALELRTRDRERKLLKKIEQSIVRIDSEDYGYCDETGEPIGIARLIARPTANLSLEAQQRRELKQKMFGD